MKEIYYSCNGNSDHILCSKEPEMSDHGYFLFTDILGRTYKLPIVNTLLYFQDFNGSKNNFSQRYHQAIDEMAGKETGVATK
jgi:hypothetical protein